MYLVSSLVAVVPTPLEFALERDKYPFLNSTSCLGVVIFVYSSERKKNVGQIYSENIYLPHTFIKLYFFSLHSGAIWLTVVIPLIVMMKFRIMFGWSTLTSMTIRWLASAVVKFVLIVFRIQFPIHAIGRAGSCGAAVFQPICRPQTTAIRCLVFKWQGAPLCLLFCLFHHCFVCVLSACNFFFNQLHNSTQAVKRPNSSHASRQSFS